MQFELEDYDSGREDSSTTTSRGNPLGLSAETQALMKKLGMLSESREEDIEFDDEVKIFYCSRTHSQLSQFAAELQKVRLPAVIEPEPLDGTSKDQDVGEISEELRHLTLGSRKNLCINPKVKNLARATAINERCLELQKPGTAVEHKCPFMPSKDDQAIVNDFRDNALAKIRDIEDLGAVGKRLGICPYYASRSAIKPSEIVTLPYPLLLQKSSREALDLSLKDHVIIIDEAHNLMDAIMGLHSASVSLSQLIHGKAQLMTYLEKFRNRLKGKNRVYVTQIVRLIDSLITSLRSKNDSSAQSEGVVALGDLMAGKGVDQINVFKLANYLQESKLARKVDGYIEFRMDNEQSETQSGFRTRGKTSKSAERDIQIPVLTHIQGFLLTLMNPSAEGRFFFSKSVGDVKLRYMLLDPTAHFQDIVKEARAVILCGGTMSPVGCFTTYPRA
jgi:chromosome transmission fidelity protein 1